MYIYKMYVYTCTTFYLLCYTHYTYDTCIIHQKADRVALEGKASRDWVDSTFERLDREIRDAKSHLLGQEEAFRYCTRTVHAH